MNTFSLSPSEAHVFSAVMLQKLFVNSERQCTSHSITPTITLSASCNLRDDLMKNLFDLKYITGFY